MRFQSAGFTGPLPALDLLMNLDFLDLSFNLLSGPVTDLGRMTRLWYLFLASNLFTGSLLDLGTLQNLHGLDVSANYFTGHLPSRAPIGHLIILYLDGNYFSGSLPDWVGDLYQLEQFSISYNAFTGPFPPGLGMLASLTVRDNYIFVCVHVSCRDESACLYVLRDGSACVRIRFRACAAAGLQPQFFVRIYCGRG
jgi:hypothetical protein